MAEASVASNRLVAPALVGRTGELRRVADALAIPPTLVVVDGEAGIGKTRLVTELADTVARAGRRPLTGRCHRIRESFPLGPVIEAVRGLGAAAGPAVDHAGAMQDSHGSHPSPGHRGTGPEAEQPPALPDETDATSTPDDGDELDDDNGWLPV